MATMEPSSAASTKPWKQKRGVVSKVKKTDDELFVEVYEGKPAAAAQYAHLLPTCPDTGYIRILSGLEEAEFKVPLAVVKNFECINTIMSGDVDYKEKLEHTIRFPDISPEVMETVLRFMFMEFLSSQASALYYGVGVAPRLVFQFEIRPEEAIAVMCAANFLGLTVLLHHVSAMIAAYFQDVPDVSTLPADLAWQIAMHLSPAGLLAAEERSDFASLNLDTAPLWESICTKQSWHDLTPPMRSPECQLSYTVWPHTAVQPTPSLSWKSIFVTRTIQQLADSFTEEGVESFVERMSREGKLVDAHMMRLAVWETLQTKMKQAFLVSYTAFMPNLSALFLDDLPLEQLLSEGVGNALTENTASGSDAFEHSRKTCLDPGVILEKALLQLPNLQLLSACHSRITPAIAEGIGRAVATRERLQVLRLAHNEFHDCGLASILRALQTARMVKLLDVSHCGTTGLVGKDAVEALRESSVEELYLEGNMLADCPPSEILLSGIPRACRQLHAESCYITDRHVAALCVSLEGHSDLQALELSNNSIGGEGAGAIFHWLEGNSSLKRLSLAHNAVTDSCVPSLVAALHSNNTLLYLSLRMNFSFGDERLHDIVSATLSHRNALAAAGKELPFVMDMTHTNIYFAVRERTRRHLQPYSDVVEFHL